MSTSRASGQLVDHLQALLRQKRPTSETIWTDLLQEWQATGIPVTVDQEDPQIEIPVGIPLPTLLDHYDPPALGARLDDPANHAIAFRPGSGAGGRGDYAEDQVISDPDAEAAELTARLQKLVDVHASTRRTTMADRPNPLLPAILQVNHPLDHYSTTLARAALRNNCRTM